MKIAHDKYYTQNTIVEKVNHLIPQIYAGEEITEIVESSAGNGAFLELCHKAYDILPEKEGIEKADFLSLKLPYKKGRLIGFNPPFGRANKTSVQFFNKATLLGDYIVFVQPISQLDNERSTWRFDLVYSEDLGKMNFSGKPVHCCLNFYKRPLVARTSRPSNKVEGIYARHIFRMGSQKHPPMLLNKNWDFRIAAWGNLRLLKENEKCDNEVVLMVREDLKPKVRDLLNTVDWKKELNHVSSPNLPAHRVLKYLEENL